MTTPETTPAKLNALAADAELYGEGCREYAQGLRAAAIELEAMREALEQIAAHGLAHGCNPASLTAIARAALGDAP